MIRHTLTFAADILRGGPRVPGVQREVGQVCTVVFSRHLDYRRRG